MYLSQRRPYSKKFRNSQNVTKIYHVSVYFVCSFEYDNCIIVLFSPDDLIGDRRTIYINSTVTPEQCTCPNVVLIHLNLTATEADSFCPRCQCKYQTRSLTVIKVVVILVLWVCCLLLFYMAFLSILEPILSKKRGIGLPGLSNRNIGYTEHHDAVAAAAESDDIGTDSEATQMRTYQGAEGVINRLGSQQSRWKLQVQEQRRNIYDRHAMLN